MTRIPFILLSTADGSPLTGASPTVTISKDGATFSNATNTPAEIGNGYYYVDLTTAETTVNNNVIVRATATGAQPAAVVWEPEQDLSGLSTFDPSTDTVTIDATQAATLATAAALATVGDNVTAVKAKTDNLPASPAAVGSEMALTSSTISSVKSGLATSANVSDSQTAIIAAMPSVSGLSTFNPATDRVLIDATQAATMTTATGFATPNDLIGLATAEGLIYNLNLLTQHGNTYWTTADVSSLATSSQLSTATESIVGAMPDISTLPSAADVWEYEDRTLTEEISVEISDENIADITESVWEAPDRTLTDMKPKPNQKSIVCTPSNVINAYGIPRLENWTNETAGTQAFDDKINTYITLAKEKMTTDLNDQINAAIAYIGADNITELCAWLTGYNLYKDDESTDTDSLPETRYNQYLEQIHRIMENI